MAVIGCYALDLYCDTGDEPYGIGCPQHKPGLQKVAQFTGRHENDCIAQAKRAGWTFKEAKTKAYCPYCSGNKIAGSVIDD